MSYSHAADYLSQTRAFRCKMARSDITLTYTHWLAKLKSKLGMYSIDTVKVIMYITLTHTHWLADKLFLEYQSNKSIFKDTLHITKDILIQSAFIESRQDKPIIHFIFVSLFQQSDSYIDSMHGLVWTMDHFKIIKAWTGHSSQNI